MKFNFVKFFLLFAVIFGLARPVLADVSYSYTRTPAGTSITSPFTISVSVSNFEEYSLMTAWQIIIQSIENLYKGDCHSTEDNPITSEFDIPVGEQITGVSLYFSLSSCAMEFEPYFLEGETRDVIFTIVSGGSSGEAPPEFGISNNSPEVKLTTEISGVYRKELPIYYSATDPDSGRGAIKSQPVIIFYSDDGGINWTELAKDQPSTGIYNFDTATVPDGTNYKIRVVAFDGYGYFGEVISETFSIDNTGPTFDVSVSPFPVREKDAITLKITPSEELKAPPKLQITQKGAEPKIVTVSGSKSKFSASYYVERGSGKAVISLAGEDLVGNVGEIITSGGSFLVGFYGPPPPTISSPINNQIFSQQAINVTGSSQPDTQIILTLNGVTKSTVRSSNDGSFKIDNVVLSTANKGYNTLSIVAVDKKGEESGEVVLKIKLNIPPEILSTSIATKETLSGQKEIAWVSSDSNDDKLVFSIEYSNDEGISWDYIISDLSETSYKIDTLQLADGSNYFLRITADDGTEKVSQTFKNVTIKNNLPYISLDIPVNYFTNNNAPVLTGKIIGSEQSITLAEYSLDGGTNWQKAIALDGQFDSLTEKIKIPISGPLKDGKYTILIRAVDTLNRSVKISRSFTVDTVPPVVEFPLLNKTVGSDMDADSKSDGLQINFGGKTEPGTKIEFVLEDKTYKTTSDEEGKFEVKDVTLPLHGPNKISLTSSDLAGNVTKIAGAVISNNPPQISILSLKEGEFLGSVKEISWEVQDLDNDSIVSRILYRRKDKEWVSIIKDLTSREGALANVYKWDVSKIANGSYQLKIVTSDGMSETEAVLNISIDNIAPQAALDTPGPMLTNSTRLSFSGRASDDFSGIKFVEYSIDGENWFKAIITRGYLARSASFKIKHPFDLKDGEYEFGARAVDAAGNISEPKFEKIIVDTTPPRIGSYTVSRGSLVILPEGGSFQVLAGSKIKFTISLEKDTDKAFLTVGERKINLSKNKAAGLWETEIIFDTPSKSPVLITASDALGNSVAVKEIGAFEAVPRGKISFIDENGASQPIKDAEINILVWSEENRAFIRWQAENYSGNNPAHSADNGEYELMLPAGKYQLLVQKTGFERVRTNDFTLGGPGFINFDFVLIKRAGLKGFFEDILEKINF